MRREVSGTVGLENGTVFVGAERELLATFSTNGKASYVVLNALNDFLLEIRFIEEVLGSLLFFTWAGIKFNANQPSEPIRVSYKLWFQKIFSSRVACSKN